MVHNIGNNVQPYIICVACKREQNDYTTFLYPLQLCTLRNCQSYKTKYSGQLVWHPKWVVTTEHTKLWVMSLIFRG